MKKECFVLIFILISIILSRLYVFLFLSKKRKKMIPLKVLLFVGSILLTISLNFNIGEVNFKLISFLNGFSIGYLVLFLSFYIVTSNLKESYNFIIKSLKNIIIFVKNNLILALRRLFMCSIEEIFWRMILIPLLSRNITKSDIIAVMLVSIIFTIDHFPNRRKFIFLEWFDLFIFSLILGFYYILTKEIISIILLHFIRNINIDFYFFCSADLRRKGTETSRENSRIQTFEKDIVKHVFQL